MLNFCIFVCLYTDHLVRLKQKVNESFNIGVLLVGKNGVMSENG